MTAKIETISADFVFTNLGKPLKNGGLQVTETGEIVGVFTEEQLAEFQDVTKYQGIIVPGFVNAHCHLELSFAAARVERGKGIDQFVNRIEELKKSFSSEQKIEALNHAFEILEEEGIVAVGDICNTALTAQVKKESKIFFRNFIEVYGLNPEMANLKMTEANQVRKQLGRGTIVPHSTYSVSEELFQLIKQEADSADFLSIHNQESEAENQYFEGGDGTLRNRLDGWKLPIPNFIPSGKSPIETIVNHLPKNTKSQVFVHNTFSSESDLRYIKANFSNPYFCLCPSSNLFIENRLPSIENFRKYSDHICLGTDSLASNDTLSILHEMKILSKANPKLSLEELVKWSSLNGAKALGFESKLGTFEVGKSPGINLIEDFDYDSFKLSDFSFVMKLY